MPNTYRMINATKDLVAFCDLARAAGWLALDTEFVRTRTYYAKLGLVQLWAAGEWLIVDPLNGVDLTPLWQLLREKQVTTVMHAAGEDLEIINQQCPGAPQHMFDTQIAWSFLHEGAQIGYAGMVEEMCGVSLDKSLSRTDWLKRPLTGPQLDYAAADSLYLAQVYPELKQRIEAASQYEYFVQECAFQVTKRSRKANPDYAWREVSGFAQMKGVQRSVMAELAKWRMQCAQQEDIALPFLMRDPVLTDIALQQPSCKAALAEIKDLHPRVLRQRGKEILAAIQRGQAVPEQNWPRLIPRLDDHSQYKQWFKEAKALIKTSAEQVGVAPSLLGSRKQINDVFVWSKYTDDAVKAAVPKPELLLSWRYGVAGKAVLALADGLS
ncbi:ribonuclease D [Aliidiomarina quisquiliarum]|uniref:ribonuclease D n=1 Tax=Aliidiomarina quisquiliarum TaxID=2938947 RepID=UPI00208EDF63|nr:ribonuclease D [Aliidiomarina quisquiliarum]MCO4320180.1 ribonuclease D [Aliidiomarina quisquiliarum]